MAVINLTSENFNKEVMESKEIVLIDFWASWCPPCKMLSPVVDEVAEEMPNIKVGKVNVDEQPELARQFKVMNIPMLVVMQNGEEVKRSVGYIPKDAVKELVQ